MDKKNSEAAYAEKACCFFDCSLCSQSGAVIMDCQI